MNETDLIETASRRLALALDALDAAAERRRVADRTEAALAAQIHALDIDRARLASDLDAATGRAHRLQCANSEIAQRLAQSIEAIRSMLTDMIATAPGETSTAAKQDGRG